MNRNLLCLGYIGTNGENFLDINHDINIEPEIVEYFYQRFKNRPGAVLFFNKSGQLVIKQCKDIELEDARYFGLL